MLKLVTLPAQIAAQKVANNVKTRIDTALAAVQDRELKLEKTLAALKPATK